jgi:fucokinase
MRVAVRSSSMEPALRQAFQSSWEQYLAGLEGETRLLKAWDLVVLTASCEEQAEAYRAQIESRRQVHHLPSQTRYLVIADPEGKRIGSGGATLHVLRELTRQVGGSDALRQERILIIHSGGDSRRLPHCSATGKLFARIPHELPDGRPSSLFDEFMVALSGLPSRVPCGVLLASGDTLILFDHLQLAFERPGVVGVAALAPAELGTHHGVYVQDDGGYAVDKFLHKPSEVVLQREGALIADKQVLIDTGLVWFDWPTCAKLLDLEQALHAEIHQGLAINLYGDLLAPLATSTERELYLGDASDGPATPALQAARERIWELLRGTLFGVERLQPAQFMHFGTTGELVDLLLRGAHELRDCGWHGHAASWLPKARAHDEPGFVAAASYLSRAVVRDGGVVCICDSHVEGTLRFEGSGLLVDVHLARERLDIPHNTVVHQLPLNDGRYVTRVYGLNDNPKEGYASGAFCGLPWQRWLTLTGIAADELWPDTIAADGRTLWNACLYPVCDDREASLDQALWLASPESATPESISAWRQALRMSLAESVAQADIWRVIANSAATQDQVRVWRFLDGVQQERPAAEVAPMLATQVDGHQRLRLVADYLEKAIDPWLPIRGYRALEVASRDASWGDRAFSALARLVRAHTPHSGFHESTLATAGQAPREAQVRAAARIDFGGGWTDTPPYCLERGGTVLNAAVELDGKLPIIARAERIAEPYIALENHDIDAAIRPRYAGDILDFADPGDPFALHKAALVFRGVIPPDTPYDAPIDKLCRTVGSGLRLTTETRIPRGSGLGTSSILAGAILKALANVLGQTPSDELLYDEALCVEQMITTGGGWQDQIGGLAPGIKLLTSTPGLPQRVQVTPVPISAALIRELDERLVLIYTGQRRLAKDLLRRVMGRWMARDPEMVACMGAIAELALEMRRRFVASDLDGLGALLSEHWEVLKRMDPGCSNPFIDELWGTLSPYIAGGKLAGAGGGGFAMAVLRSGEERAAVQQALTARYGAGAVWLWPCTLALSGGGA